MLRDSGFHVGDVADETNDPAILAQAVDGVHDVLESVLVEGSKTFVDKECIDFNASGTGLDHVRQAQGQAQ